MSKLSKKLAHIALDRYRTAMGRMQDDFYECNFCGCLTNAKSRRCCKAGKEADKEKHND